MEQNFKIALIDGLPYSLSENIKIVDVCDNYQWDSEFYGVHDFRMHGEKMARIIKEENTDAEIIICPLYPKFRSENKNYKLLAKCILRAVDECAHIINISLEVMGARYLSSEMLKAYRYAYKNNVIICV